MYEGQCEETLWMVKLGDRGLINLVTFKLHMLQIVLWTHENLQVT